MKNRIMRFRYRVGKAPSEEVVATAKVCEKKKSECQMSICVRKISNAFLRKEKESVSNVFEVIPKSENDH